LNFLRKLFAPLLSRSFKYAIKERWSRLKEIAGLACIWRYQLSTLAHSKFNDIRFRYFGLRSHREAIALMLNLNALPFTSNASQSVLISEIPLPGAICIPNYLASMIPLKNKSIAEVLSGFEKSRRKFVNKAGSRFRLKQITDLNDVARLNQDMLMPYASARHGKTVVHLSWQQVMGMAFEYGQLHLLLDNEKEVGCLIGYEYERSNERCWLLYREGFPDFIFNDNPSYREKHIVMIYLQLEWAINNGFDYYDMGENPAFADAGAAHYKRTFGAELSVDSNYNYFYLKLPKTIAAKFYWEKPLFAVEGKAVVLHLGLPDGVSADEVAERYKLLNYGGLNKVYLHCDSEPSIAHTEAVTNVYSYQKSPPALNVC
jgi:hypothetical protein